MKSSRNFPFVMVSKKAERSLRGGHVWVYDAEIMSSSEKIENGAMTDVISLSGAYLGTGFYSENSKIRVRVLTTNANETFTDAFFYRRVKYAVEYRKTVMKGDFSCCRLIFGEADGLPGLTVDRYGDILVAQILSYGTEMRKGVIFSALIDVLSEMGEKINGIYERNDVNIRKLEGLEEYKGWYGDSHPSATETTIVENGIKYNVDFENGQKTGFFLDQKYNRAAVARLAEGKRVLDCFTHTGSFALNAARGGAEHVTAVDISETALAQARKNAELNGLSDKMEFVCADVFDLLSSTNRGEYDFIILDPPAFTKSRKTVQNAERGYHEINYRAMKLLSRGGLFATCSCSHFMRDDLFCQMLYNASRDAGVELKQIEARAQSPDHPMLWNVPETGYLKFYIFQVI